MRINTDRLRMLRPAADAHGMIRLSPETVENICAELDALRRLTAERDDTGMALRSVVAAAGGQVFVPSNLIVDPPNALLTWDDQTRDGRWIATGDSPGPTGDA